MRIFPAPRGLGKRPAVAVGPGRWCVSLRSQRRPRGRCESRSESAGTVRMRPVTAASGTGTMASPLERHHGAPLALGHELHRSRAEAGREQPIGAGRRTTALQVPEQHAACFLAGDGFEIRSRVARRCPRAARRPRRSRLLHRGAAPDRPGALRRHYDAESRPEPLACQDQLRHASQVDTGSPGSGWHQRRRRFRRAGRSIPYNAP